VAAAVRLWSPLRSDEYITDARRGQAWPGSVLSCEPTEKPTSTPSASSPPLPQNHDWLYAVIEEGAAEGNPGFLTYWHQAHRRVVATRQWYTAERQRLVAALSTAGGTQ